MPILARRQIEVETRREDVLAVDQHLAGGAWSG